MDVSDIGYIILHIIKVAQLDDDLKKFHRLLMGSLYASNTVANAWDGFK